MRLLIQEKIKSTETARLMGQFNTLLKTKASILGEMNDSGELLTIPRQGFIEVFNEALIEASTDAEKSVIRNVLSKLTMLGKTTQ